MGEGQKRSQAKQYRQTISKPPPTHFTQESIFGGVSAIVSNVVNCHFTDPEGGGAKIGTSIQLVDFGKECIQVVAGVKIIGSVDGPGTALLRGEYHIASLAGSRLRGEVVEIDEEWQEFSVKILD